MKKSPILRLKPMRDYAIWWMHVTYGDGMHAKMVPLDATRVKLRLIAGELWRDAITFGKGEAYRASRAAANEGR